MATLVEAMLGGSRLAVQRIAQRITAQSGAVRPGGARLAGPGESCRCEAGLVLARRGVAGQGWQGSAALGGATPVRARLGWRGGARRGRSR